MTRSITLILLAVACLQLGGCLLYHRSESTSTNLAVTDPNLAQRLTVGESTKADVERLFGKAHSTQDTEAATRWSYGATITEENGWIFLFFFGHDGKHTRHETMSFLFDREGVLREMVRG